MSEEAKFCDACGAPLVPGEKACVVCGQPVAAIGKPINQEVISAESWSAPEPVAPKPEPEEHDRYGTPEGTGDPDSPARWGSPEPEKPAVSAAPQPEVITRPEPQAFQYTPPAPKKRSKWILIGIIAALLLCACMVGAVVIAINQVGPMLGM